ncbi:MAG: hypothetical protein ACTSW7_00585 [Candidatus Thorarchaeota archaeon]|nr:MAG: hypothetical protein DRP42_02850 [Mycoplasmatota bacterium]HEC72601.1 hypothetical protein [Thermoplasmatales archaeon]
MAKIEITKKLFIEIEDGYNFVLKRKKIITGKSTRGRKAKAENIGKEREITLGHFPNLKSTIQSVVKQSLVDLDSDNMKEIAGMIKSIERTIEHAANFDSKIKK